MFVIVTNLLFSIIENDIYVILYNREWQKARKESDSKITNKPMKLKGRRPAKFQLVYDVLFYFTFFVALKQKNC